MSDHAVVEGLVFDLLRAAQYYESTDRSGRADRLRALADTLSSAVPMYAVFHGDRLLRVENTEYLATLKCAEYGTSDDGYVVRPVATMRALTIPDRRPLMDSLNDSPVS